MDKLIEVVYKFVFSCVKEHEVLSSHTQMAEVLGLTKNEVLKGLRLQRDVPQINRQEV